MPMKNSLCRRGGIDYEHGARRAGRHAAQKEGRMARQDEYP
jgi:hypothetical protein